MKRAWTLVTVAGILSILASCAAVPPPAQEPPPARQLEGWLTSLDAALAQSRASGKPVLAAFTGGETKPWSDPWCWKLHTEVFDQKDFKEWAAKNVVLLEIYMPYVLQPDGTTKRVNTELARKYNVEDAPTIIFMDAEAKPLGILGYERGGAQVWIAKAEEILRADAQANK